MYRKLPLALFLLLPIAVLAVVIAVDHIHGKAARGYDYILRVDLPSANGEIGLPAIEGPPDASRPLVVIDAGHGGYDPGAGSWPLVEKVLTLQLAKALRRDLLASGGIRVAMTRDDDRFLALSERSGIARRLGADLFISIHADSTEMGDAQGASVYTLSERGTSEAAARMAERENRADRINGVSLETASDTVSAILVDLSQREALGNSSDFARLALREVRGKLRLHDEEVQSAAFVVLKSPDLPSVLFESGYISNPVDVAFLASEQGQATFAKAIGQAIRVYFARKAGI
jgi:N-acetylmuramoyl-L-alanine amidase